jgi:hypothetical protein
MSETTQLWDVRVHWKPDAGATCLPHTVHIVSGESQAIDAAVSALDGCRHRWAPVRAIKAEVRPTGSGAPWRQVFGSRPATLSRSYL